MNTYEPGAVAVATVRGKQNVRTVRTWGGEWLTPAAAVWDHYWHTDAEVTDVRPLVVLDLESALDHMSGGLADLPAVLKDMRRGGGIFADRIADQIEAQTKPPRIPEPGLWGVVEAHTSPDGSTVYFEDRIELARHSDGWRCNRGAYKWSELIDPTLVRPGIEESS